MILTPYQRADAYAAAFPDFAANGSAFIKGRNAEGQETIYATMFGGQDYQNASKLYGAYPKGYLERVLSMFPDAGRILHLFSGSLTKEQVVDARVSVEERITGIHGPRQIGNGTFFVGEREDRSALPIGIATSVVPASRVTQIRFDNGLHPASRAANPDVVGNAENLFETLVASPHWGTAIEHGLGGPPPSLTEGLPPGPWTRIPGVRVSPGPFDLILADPPYRLADQRRYWRESMHALGNCTKCGGAMVNHHAVYFKPSHHGGLFCLSPEECRAREQPLKVWEAVHPGYVRFKPLQKKLVVTECAKVVAPGGVLVWLDETFPMFAKRDFRIMGTLTWVRSTNHRYRVAMFFERVG